MRYNVVIAGSYNKHLTRIFNAADTFEAAGAQVLRPVSRKVISTTPFTRLEGDPPDIASVRELQYEAIRNADLLYVVNPGGLVGGESLIECGFALGQGVPVFFSEVPFEVGAQKLASGHGSPLIALRFKPNALLPADGNLVDRFHRTTQGELVGTARTGGVLTIRIPRQGIWQLVHDPDAEKPHLLARRAGNEYQVIDPRSVECDVCRSAVQRLLADLEHGPENIAIVETIHHG